MVKKVFSIVLILACLFMLVAGAFGIKDILQEKSDGEKKQTAKKSGAGKSKE